MPWSSMTRARLARDEERAAGHDVVLEVPVGDGRLEQRLRDRQSGVVDDEVDAAEGEDASRGSPRATWASSVTSQRDADGDVRPADLARDGLGARRRRCRRRRRTRPRPRADARSPCRCPSRRRSRTRPASRAAWASAAAASFASSSAQYSIRNFSRLGDGRVGGERLGAAHHVDRVDVELAGDPRGLLVRAEAEHPDARDEDDRRVGAAHRGLSGVAWRS